MNIEVLKNIFDNDPRIRRVGGPTQRGEIIINKGIYTCETTNKSRELGSGMILMLLNSKRSSIVTGKFDSISLQPVFDYNKTNGIQLLLRQIDFDSYFRKV